MVEQISRVPRILARDEIDGTQRFQSPQGNVLQVSDRGCNEIERSGHVETITKKARVYCTRAKEDK